MVVRITRPSSQPSAVFIDGSALYLASKGIGGDGGFKLNYRALMDLLRKEIPGLNGPVSALGKPSLWTMWTAAAPDNQGQNNFLDFVQRELHWEVRRTYPSQAFMVEPSALFGLGGGDSARMARLVRFDAAICFAIGRLAQTHRIVVVTDSFPLYEPLSRVAENFSGTTGEPVMAFFGRALDPRWHVAVKQSRSPRLLNLDEFEEELFGIPKQEEEPTKQVGANNLVY